MNLVQSLIWAKRCIIPIFLFYVELPKRLILSVFFVGSSSEKNRRITKSATNHNKFR